MRTERKGTEKGIAEKGFCSLLSLIVAGHVAKWIPADALHSLQMT